jgi:class 3 adenylate cyclase/tetratricopeptide (TPR) repeat protein
MAVLPDESHMATDFAPYVPRLVVEWLADNPDREWREVEGTMAFVDISGFTAMSEKLATQGKAGAEQVTEVMNTTFDALLRVAYAYGGGLLKFGGDALLVFFDDDGHERRAARAAFEMRKALRSIGRPRTSAGTVSLKMHAGLNSGRFLFTLAGSEHRELIVSGPAATTTVQMEAASQAGEILVAERTAAALPIGVLGESRSGGFLLAAAPEAAQGLKPLPPVDDLELGDCVPKLVREHVSSGQAEPEHRMAAIAFVRLSGTDELVARDGAEAAAGAVAEAVEGVQAAAAEHDVCFLESDIEQDGARIVLVAGAPRVSEHDVERLLRTVRSALDAPGELTLSVGVSRGRVFAGEVGAPFRRTYTILGGTAALAARLMAKAQPGQILVPEALVELSATEFEVERVEPLRVKGIAEPVRAVALGAIQSAQPEADPTLPTTPLIGRQREIAVLTAALAPVRMGFGTMLELVGDAGVGKTRLLQELRASAGGLRVIGARCDEYESSTPYYVFRNLLRPLVGALDGSPAENTLMLRSLLEDVAPGLVPWIPLLALPLDVEVEPTPEVLELQPAFRRARLHGVIEEFLRSLLSQPTLVSIEDVHWIDEASSELLRHLGSTNATRPWAICCARRPGEDGFVAAKGIPPVAAMTILLEPLHDDEAAEFVRSTAGEHLDDLAVAEVVRRAGGNPLFLRELVTAAGSTRTDELPDTVDAVVGTRIDRLAPRERALLRWASVLGIIFDGQVIDEVLATETGEALEPEVWERLSEFIERDPYVAGGLRFRHALIRDAAYEGLPFRRRRELHQRVGEVYERRHSGSPEEVCELLSLHFSLANDPERTWRYSLLAGERAQGKFANIEAAEFYRRALAAARTLDVEAAAHAAVWRTLADVCTLAGRLEEAKSALASARGLAPASEQAALMLEEGLLREEQGAYSEALRWYTRGEKAAPAVADATDRGRLEIALMRARAQARFRQGRYQDALALAGRVIERAADLDDIGDLAHAYYLSHVIHTLRGDSERHAFRGLALPIFEETGDLVGQASVLNNLGIEAYYEGRWDEARDLYERSRSLRERIGDVINVATTTNNIGEIELDQGRYADAEARFRDALRIADSAGHRLISAVSRGNLSRLAARSGRYADADELLTDALATLGAIGAGPFLLEFQARRAELLTLSGADLAEAAKLADETLTQGVGQGLPPAVQALLERIRGTCFARREEIPEARQALQRALEIAEGAQAEYESALALRAIALLEGSCPDDAATAIFARLGVDESALPQL